MLGFVVFTTGAVLMILELVGSRILAPYLGTSIIVWTSLIGVILASLSLGYFLGGKAADNKPSMNKFSYIILLESFMILFTALIQSFFLQSFYPLLGGNIYFFSLFATTILFAPASIFAGMVSPYAVKLTITSMKTSGSKVGNLYAISTLGSILGTFLGGFFLISYFGSKTILFVLSGTLFFLFILLRNDSFYKKIFLLLLVIVSLIIVTPFNHKNNLVDIDSLYNRIRIYNTFDNFSKKQIQIMQVNEDYSSAMFLVSNELVFPYTKYYQLDAHFVPNIHKTLMIGGGGYSYPKYFITHHANADMDVVEIDPVITKLAFQYFRLPNSSHLTTYSEDARTFLNRTKNSYDVIYGDAFKAQSPPYNLTTQEVVKKYYERLSNDGVMIVNVIGTLEGIQSKYVWAQYKTFQSVFPQVYIFPVTDPGNKSLLQNIMLVALKNNKKPKFASKNKEISEYLSHKLNNPKPRDVPILTDDFAPVEQYNLGLVF